MSKVINFPTIAANDFGGSTQQGVDARELHEALESKRQFGNWITKAIEDYGFVENQDFVSRNKIVQRETGATRRVEYFLTLDMAKELAMVQKNQAGREVRKHLSNINTQELSNAPTNGLREVSQETALANGMASTGWIAEVTGKLKKHVNRDVCDMTKELAGDGPKLDHELKQGVMTQTDSRGYIANYWLNEDMLNTLLTGYSAKLRLMVNQELRKYQEQEQQQLPKTYIEALEAHLVSEKRNQELEQQREEDRPKVEAWQQYMDSDGNYPPRTVAKLLGLKPNKMMARMRERGMLTKDNLPTAQFRDKGWFDTYLYTAPRFSSTQAVFTPKGLERINQWILNGKFDVQDIVA